jgi:hypothetical protein
MKFKQVKNMTSPETNQLKNDNEESAEQLENPKNNLAICEYPGNLLLTENTDNIPAELLPLLQSEKIKSTIEMGKAAFIEAPLTIKDKTYQFIQAKGVGKNPINEMMPEKAKEMKLFFEQPLSGEPKLMPLFVLEDGDHYMARFQGGAFYEDLLKEDKQSKEIEKLTEGKLRTPEILATIKFNRAFCEANNLPLPENDDPNSSAGQNLEQYLEPSRAEITDETYEKITAAPEFNKTEYSSVILGENIRAFRNVWRISELERIMNDKDFEETKQEQLQKIFQKSAMILGQEFGTTLDDRQFLEKFASLLAEQAAILVEKNIQHGGLEQHLQNITLAAEICDFDQTYAVNKDYFANPGKQPSWMKEMLAIINRETPPDNSEQEKILAAHPRPDEQQNLKDFWSGTKTKEQLTAEFISDWKKQENYLLYKQIADLGRHLSPLIAAGKMIGLETGENEIEEHYLNAVKANLSPEKSEQVDSYLELIKKR